MIPFLILILLIINFVNAGPIAGVTCLAGVCGFWAFVCVGTGPGYGACICVTCGSYMPICTAAFIAPTP